MAQHSHLECGDGLGTLRDQVAELIDLPALVVQAEGCGAEGGLGGGLRDP